MSDVSLRNITKSFRSVDAVRDVSFNIKDGEFYVLLGPTGSGKTTTLRIVAGLTKQDEGTVSFDGESVDELTPAQRDVAFVFQQYSLYPTMSVYDNLAFPLRSPMRQLGSEDIERRVSDTARLLHIDHLLERKTAYLSGGEMQRVSLGRALVRQPRIHLMDEPLSNLDAKLREELRVEIKHIQNTAGSTILFVTHDQIEALTMADRIAVLDVGHIVQVGTPDDIYDRPATTFVARMVGTPRINLMAAQREDGTLDVVGSTVRLPLPRMDGDGLPRSLLLGVRPEDVRPDPAGPFDGRVVLTEPLGLETILHIEAGEKTILSTVPGMTRLSVGENVRFSVNQEHLHYFGPDGVRIPVSRASA